MNQPTPAPAPGTAWPVGKKFGELTAAAPAISAVLGQSDDDYPDTATALVTVRMTPAQEESYAREYSLELHEVAVDIARRLQHDLPVILSGEYWLNEFTTVTVSDPT